MRGPQSMLVAGQASRKRHLSCLSPPVEPGCQVSYGDSSTQLHDFPGRRAIMQSVDVHRNCC